MSRGMRWRLREVSILNTSTRSVDTYYVYYDNHEIHKSTTVTYQINKVHGLPIVDTKRNDSYYKESDLISLLSKIIPKNAVVAYKGGCIESSLLCSMSRRSVNLELLGCDKYDILKDKYGLLSKCCSEHINTLYHCSRYEVAVFYFFISSIVFEHNFKEFYYSL